MRLPVPGKRLYFPLSNRSLLAQFRAASFCPESTSFCTG